MVRGAVLKSAREPAALVAFFLAACGTVEDPSPSASPQPSVAPTMTASQATSPTPTAAPSAREPYVHQAGGWSIVLPAGWEVVNENDTNAAFIDGNVIAEVLVGPSSGLALEELLAQRVDEITEGWQGAGEVQSDIVQLPAGDALYLTFPFGIETSSRGVFVLYTIERGDKQYAISVRGPDVPLAEVEALVESFVILD
jgi:hypothetical protein